MNTALWIAQGSLALIFLYSGWMKSTRTAQRLVAMGQTGVEHLPRPLIRFIGISEILGVVGLIVPGLTRIAPVLTPIAALCLGLIMVPAAIIHYRRHEKRAVLLNVAILILCAWVAYGRRV